MKDFLPFALSDIGDEEIEEVVQVLKSGWITTGPKVREFEEHFARFIGSKHAVAVNSCTAALHLALEAIGLKDDDQVIIPPLTFAATAEVVCYFGAKPVFADIDERTMNLDAEKVEEYLESNNREKVKAIIPVHYSGLPCQMDRIMKIAQQYDLRVIEDAAHAFPVKYQGRMIGTIGDATCFSFYATKPITTAEGGMLTTNDDTISERTRIMRLHGMSEDAWMRYSAEGGWYYEVLSPGFKYNLTDIAAAIGLVQLKKAHAMLEKRRQIADIYNNAFKDLPEIKTPYFAGDHAWHLYVIRLDTEKLKIDRKKFIEGLSANGIGTSVHFIPLHLHPYYRNKYHYQPEDYPISNQVYRQIVSLPIYSKMSLDDVYRVVDAVKEVIEKNRAS